MVLFSWKFAIFLERLCLCKPLMESFSDFRCDSWIVIVNHSLPEHFSDAIFARVYHLFPGHSNILSSYHRGWFCFRVMLGHIFDKTISMGVILILCLQKTHKQNLCFIYDSILNFKRDQDWIFGSWIARVRFQRDFSTKSKSVLFASQRY